MRKFITILGLLLVCSFSPLLAQDPTQPQIVKVGINITVTASGSTTYVTVPGADIGGLYSGVQALVYCSSSTTSTVPVLDVTLESSIDNFADPAGDGADIKTVFSFTQIESDTTAETKQARRTFGASPIYFGRQQRLKFVADTTSGTNVYTGYVLLYYFND